MNDMVILYLFYYLLDQTLNQGSTVPTTVMFVSKTWLGPMVKALDM